MTTHLSDEFLADALGADCTQSPAISEISVRIRHLMAILDEGLIGTAKSPDDHSALAWIVQSLEDIEATLTGLAQNEQVTDGGRLPPPFDQLMDQGSVLIS